MALPDKQRHAAADLYGTSGTRQREQVVRAGCALDGLDLRRELPWATLAQHRIAVPFAPCFAALGPYRNRGGS